MAPNDPVIAGIPNNSANNYSDEGRATGIRPKLFIEIYIISIFSDPPGRIEEPHPNMK